MRSRPRARPNLDLFKPLTDANTGILTAGISIAIHFGIKNVFLRGCDSNYAASRGSYFYDSASHASKTTSEASVVNTWREGRKGQYGFARMRDALRERGIGFFDSTLDGRLKMLVTRRSARSASLMNPGREPRQCRDHVPVKGEAG